MKLLLSGAQISENCAVEEVLLGDERQVYAVNTVNGLVETPMFVDASGIVSSLFSKMIGSYVMKGFPVGRQRLGEGASLPTCSNSSVSLHLHLHSQYKIANRKCI